MMRSIVLTVTAGTLLLSGVATAKENDKKAAVLQSITTIATDSRRILAFDGERFSGPAWEHLLQKGSKAQFFLLGEEHGIAENPKFAAQLFVELAPSGYNTLAIEISPPMAKVLDNALSGGGLDGLRQLFAQAGGEPAFFGMAEEAEMLASVRAAVPAGQLALWGADYEVAGDRTLLNILQAAPKPAAAQSALDALVSASLDSWQAYYDERNPQYIFSFAGDPALVQAVIDAWPDPDDESHWMLETLKETLEINRLWIQGKNWESNHRRATLLRSNFLRHWQIACSRGEAPRVMAKFGASHLVRGRSMTNTFDLGSLLPELAASADGHSFSVMVIPGPGSPTAVLDPSTWTFSPASPKDDYNQGLEPLIAAADPDRFTLIDLAPLRSIRGLRPNSIDPDLLRVIFGYDMLLVMSGSTASTELEHD